MRRIGSESDAPPSKGTTPGDSIVWALSALAIACALLVVWRYPAYFRADDAYYLEWAAAHDSPWAAFNPAEGELFCTVRPAVNLAWWGLYRLFGLDAGRYQFVLTLLFGFSFIIFYRLVREAFSRRVALFSLLAYGGVFYYLTYVVFWFSDIHFALEVFFLHLSLLCLVRAAAGRGGYYFIWGTLFWLVAAMSREPAALIVPFVLAGYLWARGRRAALPGFRRAVVVAAVMFGAGLLWTALSPYVRGRQVWAEGAGLECFFPYAAARWRFYAAYLAGGCGILLWAATFYRALKSLPPFSRLGGFRGFLLPLCGGAALSLALRAVPAAALVFLFAAFVPLLVRRDEASPGIVWFAVPLLGLMTVSFTVRTYLWEASFGAALVMGVALAGWAEELYKSWSARSKSLKAVTAALAVGAVILAGVLCIPLAAEKLGVLRTVADTRQNFRETVDYLRENANEPNVNLVVVEYEDMGLAYESDVLSLADGPKAHRQKTMAGDELQRFLRVAGKDNITVRDFAWLRRHADAGDVLVFIMNRGEREFVADKGPALEAVHSAERGSEGAWLMRPAPSDGNP